VIRIQLHPGRSRRLLPALLLGTSAFLGAGVGFFLIERGVFEALHRMLEPNYRGFEAAAIPRERFFAALAKDKKNQGAELRLVLMRGPGQVFLGTFASDARLRGSCEAFLDAMAAGEVFAEC